MSKSPLIWIVAVVVITALGLYLLKQQITRPEVSSVITETPAEEKPVAKKSETKAQESVNQNPNDHGGEGFDISGGVGVGVGNAAALISFTGKIFSPPYISIKKGETVRFINNSDEKTWPISSNNPSYPETREGQCGESSFDACRGLETGESWDFTFNKVGTWRFNDHLHQGIQGTITVTE